MKLLVNFIYCFGASLCLEFSRNKRIIQHKSLNFIHMKISLDILQILDAIDRHGSFSAAAEVMHRVPSALSHAIAKLENELGVTLFTREGRKASLNPAGQTLLDDGRHLLRAASELERRVQRIATGWESELRIGMDAVIPVERIYPLLERFYEAGHGTQIRLTGEVLGGTWDALATGRADLVIGAPGDMPARSGIASQLLCAHSEFVFAVAPHHPLAELTEPLTSDQLSPYRAVVVADTSRELDARSIGLQEGQPVLRVPDIRAKASAQASGLGIGHLPRWLAQPYLDTGTLIEKQLNEARQPMPLHIAWRSREIGKGLRWFLDALTEESMRQALAAGL